MIPFGWKPVRGGLPAAALCTFVALTGCSTGKPLPVGDPSVFEPSKRNEYAEFASSEALAQFEADAGEDYLIGPGDRLVVHIYGQPDLSGEHVVGPDGLITISVAGPIRITDLSRQAAAQAITKALSPYYRNLATTVRIDDYASYRVLVLGRVAKPGSIQFESQPSLLDAITRAGGLPVGGAGAEKAALTRCAVFRGRDRVVWVNLKRLLQSANLSLNLRLRRGDVVYLPDADDRLVYVMGEVNTPGAYQLTPEMSFLDALAQAGGPTKDAAPEHIEVVRPSEESRTIVDLKRLRRADGTLNVDLEEGDIIYVRRNGLADAGYVLEKLAPAAMLLIFTAALAI